MVLGTEIMRRFRDTGTFENGFKTKATLFGLLKI
jgi:hypothetical protein